MTIYKKPDLKVFGANAKPTEIAEFEDLLRGWGITIEKTNGIPPMEWFNYLFNRLDGNINYLVQNGIVEYSSDLEYPSNAVVKSNGNLYKCVRQNTNKPLSNTTYWELLIKNATTSQSGIVQLSNAVDSTDETKASTPKATKTAYDKAVQAYDLADSKLNKVYHLTSENLDDLTESGFYSQVTGGWAKPELNYPEKNAGVLFLNRYSDGVQTQIYTTYNTYTTYQRYGRKGAWNEWVKVSRRDISSSTNSTNEEVSASSLAVKTVNDKVNKNTELVNKAQRKADSAYNLADSKLNKIYTLTSENLDDLTESGFYSQVTGGWAKPELNYPEKNAGVLFLNRYSDGVQTQIYTTYNTYTTYQRYGRKGAWNEWVKVAGTREIVAVGSIHEFASDKPQKGYLKCDGGLYSTTTYAELFKEIGYTWGGSGSRFAVPNLTDKARFLRSSGNGLKVGTYQNDAIRNIAGHFGGEAFENGNGLSGAFYTDGKYVPGRTKGDFTEDLKIIFDASRVVPTSTENRPYACVVAYWIKY